MAGHAGAASIVERWIVLLADGLASDTRDGCPIGPIATESVHAGPLVRAASARAFDAWSGAVADRLTTDGWDAAASTAQSIIALIEGALILSRIAGNAVALDAAKSASGRLLVRP